MKRTSFRSRITKPTSFTLVEMLVVIGIIAILAAVIMSAGGMAIRAALRAKANSMAYQMQTGILSYYTEYGVYPVPSATGAKDFYIGDTTTYSNNWAGLIYALSGNIHPSNPTNSTAPGATYLVSNVRSIPFLSFKSTDVSGDVPMNPLNNGTNIYFDVAMDSDYDGMLGTATSGVNMPNFASTSTPGWQTNGGTATTGVAVWANDNVSTTATNAAFWVHTY